MIGDVGLLPKLNIRDTINYQYYFITAANVSIGEDFIDLGDRTLNDPTDEPPEESMIGDVGLLPKDLESMTCAFLDWLRNPENDELHNHLLSLQPVLIDELHLRMSRADSAVCCISKKALANILDNLGVTFSLSQISGGRRMVARKKGVRRKLMSQ
ncbi:hypothetical protein DICVIV_12221 [Dictyocaulus viviparus]|uniref:Uncharacterized protein n=1 Tax=Dictyocaulus viviparus TaxID=29172 RepID=A0A0D8XB17_DICVI|nr:hypothetical protein DICVIV_12221 [Dictyocaulus viviparus]